MFFFSHEFGETYLYIYIVNGTWKMNRVHEGNIYCLKKDIEHDFSWTYIFLDGGFKHFLFSPRTLGKIPILTSIFFKWVGSTTN